MSESLVEVTHVSKRFDDVEALVDVSFNVAPGETFGLLGVNGAGKTTLISILLGLIKPSSGQVKIFGLDVEKERPKILQRVSFASAYTGLPTNLTVWENLIVFAGLYRLRSPKARIDMLLERFEIGRLKNSVVGQLSAGEITRVGLCKALLPEPELLLLDEPTASLDPDIADKVRSLLQEIQRERGLTLLYTSHNMQEIERMCHRIVFLAKGRVLTEGTPTEVKTKFDEASLEGVFIRIARGGDVEVVAS
jgi:ABC-2 type transport system ATP-binding protein